MVPPHWVGRGRCPASKTPVDADFAVYVSVCICMYAYVSVCIVCMRMYLYVSYVSVCIVCIGMYLGFICMYGLDFH